MEYRKFKIGIIWLNCMLLVCFHFTACDELLVTPDADYQEQNIRDFEETWSFIDKYYPFFEFMDISSEYLYDKYRPLAEQARGDEIFSVLLNLLAELKDGHTMFKNKTSGLNFMIPYIMPRMISDYNKFSTTVVRRYFKNELIVSTDRTFEYGITDNNIGYIYILVHFRAPYKLRILIMLYLVWAIPKHSYWTCDIIPEEIIIR